MKAFLSNQMEHMPEIIYLSKKSTHENIQGNWPSTWL